MTFKNKSQAGLGHLLALAVSVLLIAAITIVGMRVINQQKDKSTDVNTNDSAPTKVVAPTAINNKEDLNTTKASLNQSSIDSDLNSDDLNGDIDSLL